MAFQEFNGQLDGDEGVKPQKVTHNNIRQFAGIGSDGLASGNDRGQLSMADLKAAEDEYFATGRTEPQAPNFQPAKSGFSEFNGKLDDDPDGLWNMAKGAG